MYINDGQKTFAQALNQKYLLANKTITQNDIKLLTNPTSASIVNQATGIVTTQKDAIQPQKESSVNIIKSKDESSTVSSMFDNKYLLYGGIGLIAIGLLYFISQD